MFKLRFYKKSGSDRGNLDHEEFFATKEQAIERYREVFVRNDYGLNPTMWEDQDGEWIRVQGW